MQNPKTWKVLGLIIGLNSHSVFSKDLVDVIPSVYGGNGVQLVHAASGFNHAPHFQDDALQKLNDLTKFASDIQLPYPNASGGIYFSYDPVLDDFIKSTLPIACCLPIRHALWEGDDFLAALAIAISVTMRSMVNT